MDASQPPPSNARNETFAVLSDEYCRYIVEYFRQSSESAAELDALVEYSARHSDGERTRDQHAIALHHVTLPKLDATGVLDYDVQNNTVQYRGCSTVERLLGHVTELEE